MARGMEQLRKCARSPMATSTWAELQSSSRMLKRTSADYRHPARRWLVVRSSEANNVRFYDTGLWLLTPGRARGPTLSLNSIDRTHRERIDAPAGTWTRSSPSASSPSPLLPAAMDASVFPSE